MISTMWMILIGSWWVWIVGLLVAVLLVGGLVMRRIARNRKRECKAIVVYHPPTTLAGLIREYLKYCKALTIWSGSTNVTDSAPNWTTPTAHRTAKKRRWIKTSLVYIVSLLILGATGFGIYNIPFSSLAAKTAKLEMLGQNKIFEVIAIVIIGFVCFLAIMCIVAAYAHRRKQRNNGNREGAAEKNPPLDWKKRIRESVEYAEYLERNPLLVPIYVILFWGVLTGVLWLLRNETTEYWSFSVWNWFVIEHSAAYWVTPLLLTGGGLLYRVRSRVAKTVAILFLSLMVSLWVVALIDASTKTPMGQSIAAKREVEKTVKEDNRQIRLGVNHACHVTAEIEVWSPWVVLVADKPTNLTNELSRYDIPIEFDVIDVSGERWTTTDPAGQERGVSLGRNVNRFRIKSNGSEPVEMTLTQTLR